MHVSPVFTWRCRLATRRAANGCGVPACDLRGGRKPAASAFDSPPTARHSAATPSEAPRTGARFGTAAFRAWDEVRAVRSDGEDGVMLDKCHRHLREAF